MRTSSSIQSRSINVPRGVSFTIDVLVVLLLMKTQISIQSTRSKSLIEVAILRLIELILDMIIVSNYTIHASDQNITLWRRYAQLTKKYIKHGTYCISRSFNFSDRSSTSFCNNSFAWRSSLMFRSFSSNLFSMSFFNNRFSLDSLTI